MPARWRACYEGRGELDLTKAELLSDAHYLWSTKSLTSRISGFFASKVMRSRSTELDRDSLPAIFQHRDFKGQFYRLDEPVFNTMSVVRALAEPREGSILMIDGKSIDASKKNMLSVKSQDGKTFTFSYKKVIFTAGQGNEELLNRFSQREPEMQRRPLKMVVMRGPNRTLNDMVYAHCLGASVNPRITITSHLDKAGNVVWYMGGQLAEDGVGKADAALVRNAQKELAELIPWLDQASLEWGVLNIDRAEIRKQGTTRPDSFSIESHGDLITAWPTKLALSPALADDLLALLENEITAETDQTLPQWQAPVYADFPWNEKAVWQNSAEAVRS